MGLTRRFSGKRIYLDANIVIYAAEAFAPSLAVLTRLFEMADAGDCTLVTSQLTLAEVLVKPLAAGNEAAVGQYRALR